MKLLSSCLILLSMFLLPVTSPAKAESVLIFSNGGGEGHGWLFGAAGAAGVECWLAFPLHVAGLDEDNAKRPFEFQDKLGRRGQSGQPMGVAEVPEALEAMGGFDDLGFARVASGRLEGDCLSRLGLNSFTYGVIIRTRSQLTLQSLVPKSFGVFAVRVTQSGAANRAHRLVLEAENEADRSKYFKGGLSGSVAQITRETGIYPVAMVTNVHPETSAGWAIRFDAIADAFPLIKTAIDGRDSGRPAKTTGASSEPFPIGEYEAISVGTDVGPGSLASPESCWQAVLQGGKSSVTLESRELHLEQGGVTIIAERSADCGTDEIPIGIDVSRDRGKTWIRTADCVLAEGELSASCRVARRGELNLRLVFSTSRLGLNALSMR